MVIKAKPKSLVVLELEIKNVLDSDAAEKEENMDFIRYKKHLLVYMQPCTYGEFFWTDLTCTPC
jgi:hypothetical protein